MAVIEGDTGIKCPMCRAARLDVIDTRPYGETVRRKRGCRACGFKFYTLEVVEETVASLPELDPMLNVRAPKDSIKAMTEARIRKRRERQGNVNT